MSVSSMNETPFREFTFLAQPRTDCGRVDPPAAEFPQAVLAEARSTEIVAKNPTSALHGGIVKR
jgi:hypothetical protein